MLSTSTSDEMDSRMASPFLKVAPGKDSICRSAMLYAGNLLTFESPMMTHLSLTFIVQSFTLLFEEKCCVGRRDLVDVGVESSSAGDDGGDETRWVWTAV